jgi:hypothetical protein
MERCESDVDSHRSSAGAFGRPSDIPLFVRTLVQFRNPVGIAGRSISSSLVEIPKEHEKTYDCQFPLYVNSLDSPTFTPTTPKKEEIDNHRFFRVPLGFRLRSHI